MTNELDALQTALGHVDGLAPIAEHGGDEFLRHEQILSLRALQTEQQPAAQALLDRMQSRRELYDVIRYEDYEALDTTIAKSVVPDGSHGGREAHPARPPASGRT